ncbi:MAG: hypothetical protein Ct9H300mP28_27030 [Pseudomonadota bacterium]|nr:MAG: hypothetical protein Ct9H300mP28_27030 [Pseudomonadota bacterium]
MGHIHAKTGLRKPVIPKGIPTHSNPAMERPGDVFHAVLQKSDLPDKKNPGQVRQEPAFVLSKPLYQIFVKTFWGLP